MKTSDFECLTALIADGPEKLTRDEIYKACVAVALNGLKREEEDLLDSHARLLLEVRRLMKTGDMKSAATLLKGLQVKGLQVKEPQREKLSPLYEGDLLFLMANIEHQKCNQEIASDLMRKAAVSFRKAQDLHRELRALINSIICVADLDSCLIGELQALEQRAKREGLNDLVGNCQRTRAIELLKEGRLKESLLEFKASVSSYELNGCPEDRAVSVILAAITSLILHETEEASVLREKVLITNGKVAPFIRAYEQLAAGKRPRFTQGHPLSGLRWNRYRFKENSIPGKLLTRLRKSSATRDELITSIWGDRATHPSYHQRLHTTLAGIKKQRMAHVTFDGERYQLSQ